MNLHKDGFWLDYVWFGIAVQCGVSCWKRRIPRLSRIYEWHMLHHLLWASIEVWNKDCASIQQLCLFYHLRARSSAIQNHCCCGWWWVSKVLSLNTLHSKRPWFPAPHKLRQTQNEQKASLCISCRTLSNISCFLLCPLLSSYFLWSCNYEGQDKEEKILISELRSIKLFLGRFKPNKHRNSNRKK